MTVNTFIVRKIGNSKKNEYGLAVPPDLAGNHYERILEDNGDVLFKKVKQ